MNNQQKKILIIHSREDEAKSLMYFLQSKGIEVEISVRFKNILAEIKERKPDLVLLDTSLQDTDIFQSLRDIKKQLELKNLPIILLADTKDNKTQYLELEGIDYINKPIEPNEAWARIKINLHLSSLIADLQESKSLIEKTKKSYAKALGKVSLKYCDSLKKILDITEVLEKSPRLLPEEREQINLISNNSERLLNILSLTANLNRSEPKEERKEKSSTPKRTLKILLAEDTAMNQKVAIHMLKRLGYDADVVENGVEVLKALKNNSYDLILMDLMMPEMDGLEATRRIYEEFRGDSRPTIIAVTANVLPESRDACLAVGMNGYITKPFYLETLAQVLEQCNEQRRY